MKDKAAQISMITMLIAASGVDAPDPTANYILLVVSLVVMFITTR